MSGWDEMMPTIISCGVDGFQYPDHGEVWNIPWRTEDGAEIGADTVMNSVDGLARPYHFSRTASLVTPDSLELGYTMQNTGSQAMPYLWAAHPQFVAEASTRIVLPDEVIRVVNAVDHDPVWGISGTTHAWPQAADSGGKTWQLDRVRSVDHHACRKFYLPPDQHVGWTALIQEERGCQLRMSWLPAEAPYLGLWVDEGAYNSLPVAAPEPSNGYYDSLEKAVQNNRVTVLEPGESKQWKLQVQLRTNRA
jgi:galactose mutarotase-like enzyme